MVLPTSGVSPQHRWGPGKNLNDVTIPSPVRFINGLTGAAPRREATAKTLSGRSTNDGGKRLRVETGAPNQRAIDLGLPEKLLDVLRLDAAAV